MARVLSTPRPWYAKVPFVSASAPPPSVVLDDTQLPLTPEATANWLSLITFGWLGDLLSLGYARPLEKSDLYRLPPSRDSAKYAARIERAFQRRKIHADKINAKIESRELKPPLRLRLVWGLTGDSVSKYDAWIATHPRAEPSLVLALNEAIFWWLWVGGALKLLADVGTVCAPLLIRVSVAVPHPTSTPLTPCKGSHELCCGVVSKAWSARCTFDRTRCWTRSWGVPDSGSFRYPQRPWVLPRVHHRPYSPWGSHQCPLLSFPEVDKPSTNKGWIHHRQTHWDDQY